MVSLTAVRESEAVTGKPPNRPAAMLAAPKPLSSRTASAEQWVLAAELRAAIVAVGGREFDDQDLVDAVLGGAGDDRVDPLLDVGMDLPRNEGFVQRVGLLLFFLHPAERFVGLGHLLVRGDLLQILGPQQISHGCAPGNNGNRVIATCDVESI